MADEWHSATSDMAVRQFDVAASKLGIDANVAARLRRPDRAIVLSSMHLSHLSNTAGLLPVCAATCTGMSGCREAAAIFSCQASARGPAAGVWPPAGLAALRH